VIHSGARQGNREASLQECGRGEARGQGSADDRRPEVSAWLAVFWSIGGREKV
jgi:hypothetical protein